MIDIKVLDAVNKPTISFKNELIDFLFQNLEQYGDKKEDIQKAIDYATKEFSSFGGFIITAWIEEELVGVVVVNKTGMGGYIPENILVYIASHKEKRRIGLGKKLMEETIRYCKGDIALHVEADNPAKLLYEKYGFTNPYLEMRLKKEL